jgi:cephalosporin hydroxylase
MNDLERYFYNNAGRLIHKWKHYFEIYERHLAPYRDKQVIVVEIGVFKGGSLQMWKQYFGPKARIVGIDIDPKCAACAEEQIEILIGDQEDRAFLRSVAERIPKIDVLIDDGGHTMTQQITTFEELFPHVAPEGVYLCEDLHTSYWPEYGGGYRSPDTFIEYSKNFIDYMHAWHAREPEKPPPQPWYRKQTPPMPSLSVSDFTRSTHSLHFYDSVLVIEKRPRIPPSDMMTGGDH